MARAGNSVKTIQHQHLQNQHLHQRRNSIDRVSMSPKSDQELKSLHSSNNNGFDDSQSFSHKDNNNSTGEYKIVWSEIVWRNIIAMIGLHTVALYSMYIALIGRGMWTTIVFNWFYGYFSGLGITAGAHRLWCHRAYKAKFPLRVILAIAQTCALQNDIFEWSRDHRVHHKFSETDADPHNSNRGFFFAHMGWLFVKKHPDVKKKGRLVDLSDLWSDPIVRFQRRFYIPLVSFFWGFLPVFIPWFFWNETLDAAISISIFRYVMSLHSTWTVNSLAHLFGNQPYDKTIQPKENKSVIYLAIGEGYHNYHHTFPWDYSTSEWGWRDNFNPSTAFIDLMAAVGWAYDLKTPSVDVILKRKERTGDVEYKKPDKGEYFMDIILGFVIITTSIWLPGILKIIGHPL